MKRFQLFRQQIIPTTFRARMLLTLVILSLVPLLLLGIYLLSILEGTIKDATQTMGKEIVEYVVDLQQQHLEKQVISVNMHLEEIQKTILLARSYLEHIYNNPEHYLPSNPLVLQEEAEGYYWEDTSADRSNVGISARATLTDDLLTRLIRSEYIEPIFKQSMQNNPHIAAMYFILPESAWRFYPKMNVKEETGQGFLPPDVDLTAYPFYYLAANVPYSIYKTVWTEPYLDITHRDLLFTATTPVYANTGELLGVMAADITINNVVDYILNFQFKEKNAYAILLDHQGRIIAAQEQVQEKDLLFLQQDSVRLQQLIQAAEPQTMDIFDQKKIIISALVPSTTWHLAFVIPREEITSPIFEVAQVQFENSRQQFVVSLVVILSLLAFILLGIALVIWKQFTWPLNELMEGIAAFQTTKKYTPLATGHLDEFNQLAQTFNEMATQVDLLIEDMNRLNQQLEHKVMERTEELAQVNASLQETNQMLRHMEQVKRETFAHIAHDLKTPLTIIVGYIEAIIDGVIPEDKVKFYLQRTYEHISSINTMVRDVYELSTVEMKEKTFTFTEVNARDYFIGILNKHHQIKRLVITMEQDLPTIHIDREYMKRAVYNLLDNAVKYSSEDSPIQISISVEKNKFRFSITDQGQGIAQHELEHIFHRFYRIDKSRNSKTPGNGLGLAIVKEIILAHHGEVSVTSEEGSGSTFTLLIPIALTSE